MSFALLLAPVCVVSASREFVRSEEPASDGTVVFVSVLPAETPSDLLPVVLGGLEGGRGGRSLLLVFSTAGVGLRGDGFGGSPGSALLITW